MAEATQNVCDSGLFRTPTLRNVALTAPYFHDGSVATLADVITHYERLGQSARHGAPGAGAGPRNCAEAEPVPTFKAFTLSSLERDDLIAFLHALTDRSFLADPAYADPWP